MQNVLQQWFYFFFIEVSKHNIDHDFAGSTHAYLHGAQPALVKLDVVKRNAVFNRPFFDGVAQQVGGLVLEVTGFNIHHFIKNAFGMKACHVLLR